MRHPIAGLAVFSLFAAALPAQQQAWRIDGCARSEYFGDAIATLPDRTGDGIPELLVGAPSPSIYGFGNYSGHVRVLSGADLSLLLDIDGGGGPGSYFGGAVAAFGDFDGDGLDDLLVGAVARHLVSLRSGADGHELKAYTSGSVLYSFGASLAVLGDLDSDGLPDFAVGAPAARGTNGNHGVVQVLSSATGAWLWTFESSLDHWAVGGRDRMAAIGDVDGDGRKDLAVIDDEIIGTDLVGVVRLLAGANGVEVRQIRFDQNDLVDDIVVSVAAAGDHDADGVDDVLIGTQADAASGPSTGYVFSGATGAEVGRYGGGDANSGWITLRDTPDRNGDGVPEVVLACDSGFRTTAPNPGLHLLDGASAALLAEIAAPSSYSDYGHAFVADLDVDGDGLADVVLGDPERHDADLMSQGAIESWSWTGVAPLHVRLGDACFCPIDATSQFIGDVDGDGFHDLASIHTSGDPANKSIELRSGADGARFAVQPTPNLTALSLASLPDLDGDGIDDYAVGFPTFVELRSAPTGAVLQTLPGPFTSFEFGRNILAAVEPNGSVRVAVADPNSATKKWQAGEIHFFDAASGALLFQLTGSARYELLGTSLAYLGDLNGDGVGEWAAGGPGATAKSKTGRVVIVDVAAGAVIKELLGVAADDHFGAAMATVSDLDGDGRRDLAIGAPDAAAQAGEVTVVATGSYANLATFVGGANDHFGARLLAPGDVNGDGWIDWAVSTAAGARVELRDGLAGALLAQFKAPTWFSNPALELRGAAPWAHHSVDGDTIPDLALLHRGAVNFGGATLVALDDLLLQLEPPSVAVGATASVATRGGPPFHLVGLELVAFAGVPTGVFIEFATLDAFGAWTTGDVVPPGFSGLTADLRSWAMGFNGKLMKSPVQTLTFE